MFAKSRVLSPPPFAFLSPGNDLVFGRQEVHLFSFWHHGKPVDVAHHPLTLMVSPGVSCTSLGLGPCVLASSAQEGLWTVAPGGRTLQSVTQDPWGILPAVWSWALERPVPFRTLHLER